MSHIITIITLALYFVSCYSFKQLLSNRISNNYKLKNINAANVINIKSQILTISFHPIESSNIKETNNVLPLVPLLYLPGLDGQGNFSEQSFYNMSNHFECWKMMIDSSDRTSFIELAEIVIAKINTFSEPPVLVGESFGGLLATYICSRNISIKKLVLVNPATSFDFTSWSTIVPFISSTGRAYPLVGATSLLATAVQPAQIIRIGRTMTERFTNSRSVRDELDALWENVQELVKYLPPETLRYRVKNLLDVGCFIMKDRYSFIQASVLIVTGAADRLLPSGNEGQRLKKLFNNASNLQIKSFQRRGHAILDGTIDLAEIIHTSVLFRSEYSTYDTVVPTVSDLQEIQPSIDTIYRATSPLYFSRDKATGSLVTGLKNVPTGHSGRPVLLVGNHQLFGLDLPLIIVEFLKQKNVLVRGLTHPFIFSNISENNAITRNLFTKYGAVEVSPISIFQLMKNNATIMLFPGGINEALHGKNDAYKLFWPEKTDFVRMAAMMDALIVPFAAVGMAESLNTIVDESFTQQMPQARAGVIESLTPPFIVPKLPSRNYFLFQEAYDTREIDMKNKTQCNIAYKHIRKRLEEGIVTLQDIQKKDPYRDFLPRIRYELINNKQAPTSSIINK